MQNTNIKFYLNSFGKYSPFKSEERRLQLKKEREEKLRKSIDKEKTTPMHIVYLDAVEFLYAKVTQDEFLVAR